MQLWTANQQLQNGKFTIQKVLGGGGYGVTYSALDTGKNKTVAIKTLNPIHHSQADFEQQQIKFVQEAFRLVQCNHPHIVKVHFFFSPFAFYRLFFSSPRRKAVEFF